MKGMALSGAAPCRGTYADVLLPCACCRIRLAFSLPRSRWAPSVPPAVAHLLITTFSPSLLCTTAGCAAPPQLHSSDQGAQRLHHRTGGLAPQMGLALGGVELGGLGWVKRS